VLKSPVAPGPRGHRYVLDLDDVELEVDPAMGGRVTALRAGGHDLLTGPDVDPANYGSTFWTSPQAQWGWPPVAPIDHEPYAVAVDGGALVMRSATSARLGVAVEKRFAADGGRRRFTLDYGISNPGTSLLRTAPWEVTRVRPGGLTFYPSGAGPYPPSNLPVRQAEGVTWFAYDPAQITGHHKLFDDGREGWIAHLDGDRLLVKAFAVVPREQQAPGEAQIEIYANPERTYVEMEEQGAYADLAPGATAVWRVEWVVRRLPAGVAPRVGSPDLVALARAMAAGTDGG
jgi:hypothetical protein